MSKITKSPKTVLETILDWSHDRPMWQRDALRRIIVDGHVKGNSIAEILDLCKNKDGLAVPLEQKHLPANPDSNGAVSILSLKDIKNVNNLADNQILSFRTDGLNIIYGDNGSGKSGYVRVFKRICRARHSGEIQPNIFTDPTTHSKPSATIAHILAGSDEKFEKWIDDDQPHSILSAASVFDINCAAIHLSEKNEVAFRPFGLDIPDELASLCLTIKELLSSENEQLAKSQAVVFLKPIWGINTQVGKILNGLTYNSTTVILEELAVLTDAERLKYESLKIDLTKDPVKASQDHKSKADNLRRLLVYLKNLTTSLSDNELSNVFNHAQDVKVKRSAVSLAADSTFSEEQLQNVGGEAWRFLWDAARKFSLQDAYPDHDFPNIAEEAVCVLCQQPLSIVAADRLKRFEIFVQSDVEQTLQASKSLFKIPFEALKNIQIDTRSYKVEIAELLSYSVELAKQAVRLVAIARTRRYLLISALKDDKFPVLTSFNEGFFDQIADLIKEMDGYVIAILKTTSADNKAKLESEFAELSDRIILKDLMPTIQAEIERLKKIKTITDNIAETNTQSITRLGNDIADSIITPKLRDRFQEEIVKLAAEKVRVEIIRSGGKYGSPHYQIKFLANPNAKVANILSEGEQTCVSLAAFLTELATANHNSTLIFDDPVSSLDHKWRDKIAKRLAEESLIRQIIVFTHDITFVHDLLGYMEQVNTDKCKTTFLNKGITGVGIVNEGLPWIAKSVEDRIDKLEKDYKAAKVFHDNDDEDRYSEACVGIYNHLRATWERALEDIAFQRVIQRHRDYINQKNLKKATAFSVSDYEAFSKGFKKCCDITDSHDPSRGRNSSMPSPTDIKDDIEMLHTWVKDLKQRQNVIT